jgi:hypothetical protein
VSSSYASSASRTLAGAGGSHRGRGGATYGCLSCGTPCETSPSDGMPPDGWYRLKIAGPFDTRDVRPGSYCSPLCLAIGALKPFGMHASDVRQWLETS